MNVKELKSENLNKIFEVFVPADKLEEMKKTKLEAISKNVKIQGFRPGKAPANIVEGQYKNKVIEEVVDQAINNAVEHLYKEYKLRTISSPSIKIDEFTMENGLKATIEVEVFPEIKAVDFSKIKLNKQAVEIDEKAIQESLDQMANYYKSFEDITEDKPSELHDVVVIDFLGKIDGEPFAGGEGKDFPLELGSNMFIPGFEEQLLGKKVNDKVEVKVPFPQDYHAKSLAGKEAVFEVTINKMQKVVKAEINDDLAKKSGFDNLDALKKDIKEKYVAHIERIEKSKLKKELMDILKKEKDMEVPSTLLNQELKLMWDDFINFKEHMKTHEGKDHGHDHTHTAEEIELVKKSDEEVKAEHKQTAEERIRLGLLLNDTAAKNDIKVTEEDISRVIAEEASLYNQDPSVLLNHYKSNEEAFHKLQNRAFEDNIINFILSKVKYNESKIDFDSYIKEVENSKK